MSQGRPPAGEPTGPKPYDFVPFAKPLLREMPVGVETLWAGDQYFSGELEFYVHTLAPTFVAAGRYALSEEVGLPPNSAVRGFYRLNGVPTIPASTLKGVVRGVAEAVSPSHVTTTRLDIGDLADTNRCVVAERACPACALFGSGGRQAHMGLVRFEDARLTSATPTKLYRLSPMYAPRATWRGAPGVYLEGGEFKGRKFYFHGQPVEDPPSGDQCEVLPPKARLSSRLSFRNLDAPLLGLLLFALGFDQSFKLNLGAGKPLCLGSVEIVPLSLTLLNRQSFLADQPNSERLTDDPMIDFIRDKLRAGQEAKLILGPQVRKLREILKWPNSRPAPGGAY
jgi:hypothetical protein